MYEILVELIDAVGTRGDQVISLVDAAAADQGRGRPVGIDYGEPVRDAHGRLSFSHPGRPLFEHDIEGWDLESHRERRIPGRERRTHRATFLGRYEPRVVVAAPDAYVVPAARTDVLRRLASHRLELGVLTENQKSLFFDSYRVTGREPTASPDVGDHVLTETVFRVEPSPDPGAVAAGDVLVATRQPWGRLATYLLEPHSDDGLARWGIFDDVRVGDVFPVGRIESTASLHPHDLRPWRP
jgi:hypothetical protein